MRFYVGVTDNAWFDFLQQFGPDEINFWRPNGKEFSALEPGEPFLFKLHSPLKRFSGRCIKCVHTFTLHVPSSGAAAVFLPPVEALQ
jgi:putative restriction endonuclease